VVANATGKVQASRKPKAQAISKKKRAGLHLSPVYVGKSMRRRLGKGVRLSARASVAVAGALEYLAREVVWLAMKGALEQGVLRIQPKHIAEVLDNDRDLAQRLPRGVIPVSCPRSRGEDTTVMWSDLRKSNKK